MEIVYAPKKKVPLDVLVQYPPKFNKLYLCGFLSNPSSFSRKIGEKVQAIEERKLNPHDLSLYYRKQIQKQMLTQSVVDLDALIGEQWEEAILIPCTILGGTINKVPTIQ